jgi:hypothetical protein
LDHAICPQRVALKAPDGALPLLPLEFFRQYWQYVAGPVAELVEVAGLANGLSPALPPFVNMGDDFEWLVSPFLTGVLVTVLVVLPCFIIWEMAERHPALDIRLFGHRNFTIGIICSMLGELQTSNAAPTPQPTVKRQTETDMLLAPISRTLVRKFHRLPAPTGHHRCRYCG